MNRDVMYILATHMNIMIVVALHLLGGRKSEV